MEANFDLISISFKSPR